MASTNFDRDSRAKIGRRWLEIALVFVVFFVAGGAPAPHVNDTHYLTKAKHYWQPEWCAGDFFLESADAHLTFYWTVGWLTQWFSLATVAWIGRVVVWGLLAVAWQRLSRCVVRMPMGAVLTAMLLVTLVAWTNFAGEWVIGSVEGKCFAYALVFWGLAAMAEGRWRVAWPCFGLAGAFHVLVGGWSAIVAAMVWWWQAREERPSLGSMLPALVLGGVLALPGIVPALQLTQQSSAETVQKANQIYVFDRLPHHLSPLTMNPAQLARKSRRFGLLLLGFALLRYVCLRQMGVCLRQMDVCRQQKETDEKKGSFRPLDLVMQFAVGALLLSLAGLVWEGLTWNHPAVAARVLKYYVFRLADIAVPLATSLGVVWLASVLIGGLSGRRNKLGQVLLLVAVLLPTWHLVAVSYARFQNPCPPAVRGKHYAPVAWQEACDWVREQTPVDSLFLVPRHGQSFKWYAHRADLITWKDVPQDATALLTWQERFFDVHRYVDEFGERVPYRSLASQGTERIRGLTEKYRVDFVLAEAYPPLDLPVVFENDWYAVYSVKKLAADERR